ncbi:MAG: MCE family protein [Leptospiraceae bacterium]|nr:MCE family protein [Leptospiraceae bacterium]MCP5493776.1 MCE family protein [Leptospiraceae bacterium]
MKATAYILVGILFFGALAVIGYFTIITEGGPLKKELYSLKIYFKNAEGIKIGNKVTVQGVANGYVSKVDLVQVDETGKIIEGNKEGVGTMVEVTISLPSPIKLYENYTIKIKNESLLSGRVIAIDPGTAYDQDPKTGKMLPGAKVRKPIDFQTLSRTMVIEGKTTEDPLVTLSELIAENRADIRKTVSNISLITEKINNGNGTIGKLINNDEIHKNVNTALSDAQIVLRELREGLEDTREQAPVTSFIRALLSAF